MTPPPPPFAWRRWLPAQARALFVGFHVVAVGLMALPAPEGGMRKSAWKDPTVQGEFAAWTERIRGWGFDVGQAQIEDRAWEIASAYTKVRNKTLRPIAPYYKYTGAGQSWRMFVAPHRFPARLHIDVREAGAWRNVYEQLDPGEHWLEDTLEHDRFRSALFRYSWKSYRRHEKQFSAWLAKRAAVDFPDADRMRTRWYKFKTPSPIQVREDRAPAGTFTGEREVDLTRIRATNP